MAGKYDVIVVGAGPSGLFTAALLGKYGKKVLVLEANDEPGGRAACIKHKGHILDNGAHGPGNTGALEKVYAALGKPSPKKVAAFNDTEIYDYAKGQWLRFSEQFTGSRSDMRKIIEHEVVAPSYQDLEKYDDVSLEEWVDERTQDEGTRLFFWSMGMSFCVSNRFEPISTGEFLRILKRLLEVHGNLRQVAGVFEGGYARVLESAVGAVKETGGEIRTKTRVSNIVVESGRATGVEIEAGPRLLPAQIVDVELIEAPVVICTVPIWDMFSVISERLFPSWYVDWVHSIQRKVSYIVGFTAGFDKPLWTETTTRCVPRLKRCGLLGNFQFMPEYGSEANEYQGVFAIQGHHDEIPNVFEASKCDVRLQMRKLLDDFESDVKEITPGFEANCKWKVRYAGFYSLAASPAMVGAHRIQMQPPGIKNLYLANDVIREARGIAGGIDQCAAGALACVERVLER